MTLKNTIERTEPDLQEVIPPHLLSQSGKLSPREALIRTLSPSHHFMKNEMGAEYLQVQVEVICVGSTQGFIS